MHKQKILYVRQFETGGKKEQNIYDEILIYPYTSKWERKCKRLCFSLGVGRNWLVESFKDVDLDSYDLIVLVELCSWNPVPVIQYIREQNSHCHLLYWMRNTWFAEKYGTGITEENFQNFLDQQEKFGFKIIAYDKGDCRRYGLLYAPQASLRWELDELQRSKNFYQPQWDVFWYGKDKDRIGKVLSIKKYCDEHELTYSMNTLRMNQKHYTVEEKTVLAKRGMSYKEYLEMILKSRATLDILQRRQEGLGARPVETLQLERKLITDYTGIQEYDFYRKENIFILGEDDYSRLKDFILSPYQKVPERIVSQYTFEGMLQSVYQTLGWEWEDLYRRS